MALLIINEQKAIEREMNLDHSEKRTGSLPSLNTAGTDQDSLLDQTWIRLLWALFSTRLRFGPHLSGPTQPHLGQNLLHWFSENPLLWWVSIPYAWDLLLAILHPLSLPFCSLASSLHLSLLYSELILISLPWCNTLFVRALNKIHLILTSVRIIFFFFFF